MKRCLAEGYPFVLSLAFDSFDIAVIYGRVPMPDLSTEEGQETHTFLGIQGQRPSLHHSQLVGRLLKRSRILLHSVRTHNKP